MYKHILLGSTLAITFLLSGSASSSAQDTLTITGGGGALQDSQRKAFIEPYVKETGAKITEDQYSYEIAKIRVMVEANNVTWDVVDVDGAGAAGFRRGGAADPDHHLLDRVQEAPVTGNQLTVDVVKKLLDGLKVLGEGELNHALTVKANAFSASARAKIENAGGTAEVI